MMRIVKATAMSAPGIDKPPGGPRNLAKTLEGIDLCMDKVNRRL